jgi:hypothetical protein
MASLTFMLPLSAKREGESTGGSPDALVPMPGFASSDCLCDTHRLWFQQPSSLTTFSQRLGHEVQVSR